MTPFARRAIGLLVLFSAILAAKGAAPFRGNTRSHVFHQESCRYYACENCTAKFSTAQEAIDAGYRPCGVCEPSSSAQQSLQSAKSPFVGNTNSHKFHKRSCRYASCANCQANFDSRDEAIAAGYAPGGCCRP